MYLVMVIVLKAFTSTIWCFVYRFLQQWSSGKISCHYCGSVWRSCRSSCTALNLQESSW